MFKKAGLMVLASVLFLASFTLSGCNGFGKRKIYEEGFFQYIIVGQHARFPKNKADRIVAIVGFTESGKQQEVIDIPRAIDGIPVWHIGHGQIQPFYGSPYYQLESPNLKKLYIHDNIVSFHQDIFGYWRKWRGEERSLDLMYCVAKESIDYEPLGEISGYIYVYKKFIDERDPLPEGTNWQRNKFAANITFMNNYSDEVNLGFYRLDNVEAGACIPIPPPPVREGYTFTNWHTEPACTNIWNFETTVDIPAGDEFRLYAGWQ